MITINSFHRGVGKSHLAVNVAVLLALRGKQVGLLDNNLHAPVLHRLLGITEHDMPMTFNDYLLNRASLLQCVAHISDLLPPPVAGNLFLIPASTDRALLPPPHTSYHVEALHQDIDTLSDELSLDALIFDTSAGLNEENLPFIALSDTLIILLHLDQQDYQGTSVTVEVAQRLDVPHVLLVVNEAPLLYDQASIKLQMEQTYRCELAAILPYTDEMMALASTNVFALHYPDHPLTTSLARMIERL